MSNATTTLLSLSGAQLRAEPTNPAYVAELARRMAKREAAGKVTVAALKSWGRTEEAANVIAHAKAAAPAKAPKATKVAAAPAPKVTAFTRTNEVVASPKSAIGHLHNRMCNLEAAVLANTSALASTNECLKALINKLAA